jgi:hypothetical protein
MNGCDYLLHVSNTGVGGAYNGSTDIVCPGSSEITIDAGPCTIHIPGQSWLVSVGFQNLPGGFVRMSSNISAIRGTVTKNNFLCFYTAGEFTNGTASGWTELNAPGTSLDIG